MACVTACYALMVKHIVTLIRVIATLAKYVHEVLRGVYAQSSCGRELSPALATYAVARLATDFDYLTGSSLSLFIGVLDQFLSESA